MAPGRGLVAEGDMHKVGALIVPCSRCDEELTVSIYAGLVRNEDEPGKVYVRTTSDVDAYWMHTFQHQEGII